MSIAMKPAQGWNHRLWKKDGIMLVNKESGPTSFGVVERIKKLTGARKVGHAGTLDPFATGLLVVLVNQGTKLSPFLMSQDKVYQASLRLGIETDTDDVTGTVIAERGVDTISDKDIEETIQSFSGIIKQTPPRYSAVHHKGKRAGSGRSGRRAGRGIDEIRRYCAGRFEQQHSQRAPARGPDDRAGPAELSPQALRGHLSGPGTILVSVQ